MKTTMDEPSDMVNALSITTNVSQDVIPADSPVRLVYLLLEIQPGECRPAAAPPAVDIAFVVDQSASMRIPILPPAQLQELARLGAVSETMVDGIAVWHFKNLPTACQVTGPRNIDCVKLALATAVEKLSPADRFSVIAFARETSVLIDGETSHTFLTDRIEQLEQLPLGNETRLAAGMQQAYRLLKRHASREPVQRMIVLTDGFTLDAPQCHFLAEQAAQDHISISTMGLGVEFNEELLISLADTTGGNAYFIRIPEEIGPAFDRELAGLQNVVLRDLGLKMQLMPGVDIRRAHRVKPMISTLSSPRVEDGSLEFALGELSRDEEIAFLFELVLPTRPMGDYPLARFRVEHRQPERGLDKQEIHHDCVIHYQAEALDRPPDPRVLAIAQKLAVFHLQTRALADAARGDLQGATLKLKATATRLIDMGESRLAQAALSEAANLTQSGQMSMAGSKRLRYDTRRLK